MAYIGYQPSQLATAPFAVNTFTGDGSTTTFTLSQAVPGANEAMVEVVVENVQQNPIDAYTIGGGTNTSLIFSEAPASGVAIYVIHKGEGTYNLQPSTGSVTSTSLDPVLRNFTVDTFTGNGSTTSYTLTDTPYSANSVIVTVDGILQTATTNYTVSGTTLSFGTDAPASGAAITVLHLGFSTGNKSVADGTITTVKLNSAGIAPTITGGTITGATFAPGAVGTPSITTTGDTNTGIYFPAADTIAFAEGGAEAMRIDSAGLVGIGNSAPAYRLDITQSLDGVGGINVRNASSGTSARAAVLLSQDTNVAASAIWVNSSLNTGFAGANSLNLYNGLNAPIGLFTGGTQRMTIDASGNVGIATTSPSTYGKFAVVGNGYFSGNLSIGATTAVTNLTISSASAAVGGDGTQYVQAVYTGSGTVNAGYTAKNYYGTSQFFQWENHGTRMGNRVITNSGAGATIFTYGNDTEGFRINASAPIICLSGGNTTATGTGIAFPATQSASANANTLDDYEEGTFTPGVAFGGASVGITFSGRSGIYTKIGRNVYYSFGIALSNKGSSTGTVTVTGFPYASGSGKSYREEGTRCGQYTGVTTDMTLWVQSSVSAFLIINPANGQAITEANFANNGSIFFCGHYVTD